MFGRPICLIETGLTISHPVDAAGDGCAPKRRCGFQRPAGARRFFAAPNRSMFGRRIRVIEPGLPIGHRIDAAETAARPTPLRFPTRR